MINLKSKDFYVNLKTLPDVESREYAQFWENEWEKMDKGVMIGDWYCSGWLYWHLNHWTIPIDKKREDGQIVRQVLNPELRDNEIIIAEHLHAAEQAQKGLLLFGSRRLAKSVLESSYIGRKALIYPNTENVISGLNKDDIKVITDYCERGLGNLHKEIRPPRLEDKWDSVVSFGYKESGTNKRVEWSSIHMRNFSGGNNTEALAGLSPSSLIIDEIGKGDIMKCFTAARPAFDTPEGWRCSPILTGTGGDFTKSKDAQEFFYNPEAHNFLACSVDGYTKKMGLFMSAHYSLGMKKSETTLKEYLKSDNEELAGIKIKVKPSEDEANQKIVALWKQTAESDNDSAYLKMRMYYPIKPEDMFLIESDNNFPVEAAQKELERIEKANIQPLYVDLYRGSDGKVMHKYSKKKPITDFPVKKGTDKDAPIQVWEMPQPNREFGITYVAGADPYNQSSSEYSESLGVVYIFKRALTVGGEYSYSFVASYAARPALMNTWHENVEMLLEWYDAVCFPENEAGTFIQYFDQRHKGHLLADGINFLREVSPNSKTGSRIKGAAATPKIIEHCMASMVEYTREMIQVGTDGEGNPIKKMGITRIPDKMLLREIIQYYKGGNFDRIVAARHAIAYANFMDRYDIHQSNTMNEEISFKTHGSFIKPKGGFIHTSRPFY